MESEEDAYQKDAQEEEKHGARIEGGRLLDMLHQIKHIGRVWYKHRHANEPQITFNDAAKVIECKHTMISKEFS